MMIDVVLVHIVSFLEIAWFLGHLTRRRLHGHCWGWVSCLGLGVFWNDLASISSQGIVSYFASYHSFIFVIIWVQIIWVLILSLQALWRCNMSLGWCFNQVTFLFYENQIDGCFTTLNLRECQTTTLVL